MRKILIRNECLIKCLKKRSVATYNSFAHLLATYLALLLFVNIQVKQKNKQYCLLQIKQ